LPKFSWFSKKFLLVLFATDRGSGKEMERERRSKRQEEMV
jgi:hypothetical protein